LQGCGSSKIFLLLLPTPYKVSYFRVCFCFQLLFSKCFCFHKNLTTSSSRFYIPAPCFMKNDSTSGSSKSQMFPSLLPIPASFFKVFPLPQNLTASTTLVDYHFWMLKLLANDIAITNTIYQKPKHTNRYLQFIHTIHDNISFQLLEVYTTGSQPTSQMILNTFQSTARFNRPSHSTDIVENIFVPKYRSPIDSPLNPPTNLHLTTLYPRQIQCVLNEAGVKVAMKPHLMLGKLLLSLKNLLGDCEKSCLVYQVPCHNCDFVYIGQTKRDLKSRLVEHKRAIKYQSPEKSAFCEVTLHHHGP